MNKESEQKANFHDFVNFLKHKIFNFNMYENCDKIHCLLNSHMTDIQIFEELIKIKPGKGEEGHDLFMILEGRSTYNDYNNGKVYNIHQLKEDFYVQNPHLLIKPEVLTEDRLSVIEKRLLRIEQFQANILDKITVIAELMSKKE